MARLEDLDVTSFDDHERVLYVQAWEKQRGYIEAHFQPALVAVAGPAPQPIDDPIATLYAINDSDDVSREEVCAALGLSPAAAQSRIEIARALQTRLRGAAGALGEGTIGFLHVRTLVRETAALTDEQARAVDERVTGGQGCRSLSGWSRGVRRAVRRVAPAEFEVAAAAAHARRHLRWWPEADGMATISAFLPAHDAQTVWLALDALAQRGRDRSNEASESPRPRSPAPTRNVCVRMGPGPPWLPTRRASPTVCSPARALSSLPHKLTDRASPVVSSARWYTPQKPGT